MSSAEARERQPRCGAAAPTERGDLMFRTMLERAAAAIDDLSPGALG
ncbi:hypothetical protein [Nocardia arizonensis]|nr:hypothetical protein [Nocardia arizonensis]